MTRRSAAWSGGVGSRRLRRSDGRDRRSGAGVAGGGPARSGRPRRVPVGARRLGRPAPPARQDVVRRRRSNVQGADRIPAMVLLDRAHDRRKAFAGRGRHYLSSRLPRTRWSSASGRSCRPWRAPVVRAELLAIAGRAGALAPVAEAAPEPPIRGGVASRRLVRLVRSRMRRKTTMSVSPTAPHVVVLDGSPLYAAVFASIFAAEGYRVSTLTDCAMAPGQVLGDAARPGRP